MKRLGLLAVVLALATSSCVRATGSMGGGPFPMNLGDTVLAWWNKYRFEQQDKTLKRVERKNDPPIYGEVLHLFLVGFRYNPSDDQRYWNAVQRDEYEKGWNTQPWLRLTVHRAGDLKAGKKVEYDSASAANIPSEGPFISGVAFSRGRPRVHSSEEYPKETTPLASREKVTIELDNDTHSPGGFLMGTVKYEREKADNDPDDAVEGELELAFTAQVISERLAECNYGNAEDDDDLQPCSDLESDGEPMAP
ncbi:MAG: hypothetical protein AB2A00_42290 [Myxococcota bacterium]